MGQAVDKKVVISSLAYKFTERLAIKVIGLIISVILARLLTPEDFGQVAILTVFINLSQTIIQSGLNVALVQNKDVTDDDFSTVFLINIALAIIMVSVLNISAPIIADFYESDSLILPLRIYSFSLLFGAFNSIQLSRMERMMKFKSLMFCGLISTILSGIVGVFFAYQDIGIWALIIYYFSNVIFNCIAMLLMQKWLPTLTFSISRAKILFNFGWKMLVSSLLCSLYNDIQSLIIGKKYSSADLGYYDRGQQFPYILANTLDASVQSVMLPTLSFVQDNTVRFREMLRRAIKTSSLVVVPAMFGLAMISEPLVKLLLTDKWIPCVPYMKLLCFAWASVSFTSSNLVAIKALGKSDVYMKLEIVRRLIMLVILAVSVVFFDDVMAIAIGFVISKWIDVILIITPINKTLGYSLFNMICDTWKTTVSAVLMCAVMSGLSLLEINSFVLLVIQVVLGAVIFCAMCRMFKSDAYIYVRNEIIVFLRETKSHEMD